MTTPWLAFTIIIIIINLFRPIFQLANTECWVILALIKKGREGWKRIPVPSLISVQIPVTKSKVPSIVDIK